jgi:hypothetical protein
MLQSSAQTDVDAIMMSKNNFCGGLMYTSSKWDYYWEGTLRRNNLNLGTVSTQMIGIMGNYGLKDNVNILFSLPYVTTKASAGTLAGQKGIQDFSLMVKWMPIEKKLGKGTFSLYALGGFSTPASNYVADFLPLSIGLHATNATGRLMVDYQVKNLFVTASAAYALRSNISIDRNAYYTTEMHYTNKVWMPNTVNYNIRAGYRSSRLIAEGIADIMQTNGGFDITRNNMPFPSNQMNATRIGANIKYTVPKMEELSLIGNTMFTIAGRNIGQSTSISAGVFYIIDFTKKKKSDSKDKK